MEGLFASDFPTSAIPAGRINSRDDREDTMLCGNPSVPVYILRDAEIMDLGSIVLRNIMESSITEETSASIILLAWNLRNSEDITQPIFPNHSPCASLRDSDLNPLQKNPINTTASTNTWDRSYFPDSLSEAAACIAYTCASLLRLFTKPVESYHKSLYHIKANFTHYYHFEFPLLWSGPPKHSLEAISTHFRRSSKYGMAGMLYLHSEISAAQGLRTMLYEEHLRFSGLHAFELFIGVVLNLRVPIEVLIDHLEHQTTTIALKTLSVILGKYFGDDVPENLRRGTWKYPRIFFADLQTKNCPVLVSVLAHLSHMVRIKDDNAFKIFELQKMAEHAEMLLTGFLVLSGIGTIQLSLPGLG